MRSIGTLSKKILATWLFAVKEVLPEKLRFFLRGHKGKEKFSDTKSFAAIRGNNRTLCLRGGTGNGLTE